MTDKHIIIDGVDVSGCKHYEDHTLYDCNETCEINGGIICTNCKDNPNCNYKQLKRKEKECEELKLLNSRLNSALGYRRAGKKTFIDLSAELDQLKEQLQAKEQEYEKLKEGITPLMNGDYCVNVCGVKQQFNQLKAEVELLRQYKGSKQASYESMQIEWNKAVSQNQDLLKQNEAWQKKYDQLKAENEELKKCYKNNSALLDFEETNTTKLVNKVMKLEKTLTEIKEIINDFAKQDIITFPDFEPKRNYDFIQKQCGEPIIQILQKISECEGSDE